MFLVMFILPQILLLGDRIVEGTSFKLNLPQYNLIRRVSGPIYVNGRVRGKISGIVDADIHGVIHGDVAAAMSSGSYKKLEEAEQKNEEDE